MVAEADGVAAVVEGWRWLDEVVAEAGDELEVVSKAGSCLEVRRELS